MNYEDYFGDSDEAKEFEELCQEIESSYDDAGLAESLPPNVYKGLLQKVSSWDGLQATQDDWLDTHLYINTLGVTQ